MGSALGPVVALLTDMGACSPEQGYCQERLQGDYLKKSLVSQDIYRNEFKKQLLSLISWMLILLDQSFIHHKLFAVPMKIQFFS
ncbi:MAG: hypothetical protein DIZ78_13910 [endosymbiont of Escarpia spicata]|uniref:Uncharacterized protein n=1 Tax=endosymbiont of Escarpia spicata TaxID=2200908 RepID=A0A370DHH0_9GAMM|nr:MAG: hypothetical protein DIZ78_13910 [endosymbiont of Escarpia spicata]